MTIDTAYNIAGTVEPGFEEVRDAFVANFVNGKELGASFAAYYQGRKVVDLVGGWADAAKTKPYTHDSIQVVHSSGKAIIAMSIGHAVSEGKLDYQQRIADVWPEFAEGGKEQVLLKDLLEHSGGVGWLDQERCPTIADLTNLDELAKKIAGQPHNFGGAVVKSYHAITRGWFLNELLRRTLHTTQGDLVKDWSAKLGVHAFVGLPESADPQFCPIVFSPEAAMGFGAIASLPHDLPMYKSFAQTRVQGAYELAGPGGSPSNVIEVLRGQTPSAYTVTNGAGLAAFANVMAVGGSVDGLKIMDSATHKAAHVLDDRTIDVPDACLGYLVRATEGGWAENILGTKIPNVKVDWTTVPPTTIIPDEYRGDDWQWCGWDGLGGSLIQWERKRQCAVGYAPTMLGIGGGRNDDRAASCTLAFVNAVTALEKEK
ncbi:beta-lactamase/transpeptidase-like protein [Gonapodya prolifera JEL478]|uniref:Beta-lactamase/transpeptidase-like protein n=1 Tax=Gonapodya prolifera (strain JEL478) TaxID=1344416 RepID=A0A139AH27_GONPJ|nr:beta-lactamase/transpeptidase-like protein [Gonapodya prolifera JEL478]|eukprot:KXS16106.1 beta-lactamase/transpeptidase-like protein [Gonapodya prolifera JEL478]